MILINIFKTIYSYISNYVSIYPSYITRRINTNKRELTKCYSNNVFIDLNMWYNNYYLTNETNRHVHTKMQLWCVIQRINEIKSEIPPSI